MKAQKLKSTYSLWTPAAWDSAMATDNWPAVYRRIEGDSSEAVALRLLCVLASRDKAQIQEHLDRAQGLQGALIRGARMCAMIDLEQYGQVLGMQDAVFPAGSMDLDWMDACNAAFAVGMAAGALGKTEVSYAQLLAARVLAHGLGMTYREQHIGIELESVRTVLGDPSPTRIRQAMDMAPMTARRVHRSGIAIADAHMALGDYTAAQAEAPPGSDLRVFLDVLLGKDTTLLPREAGDYAPLALAFSGQAVAITPLTNEPEAGYEALTRAYLLSRSPVTAGQAAAVLAGHRSKTPDQRLLWSAFMWSALAEGATAGVHASVILEEYSAAIDSLIKVEDVAGVLQRFHPRGFTLFAFMPNAHPIFTARLMDIPLLAGNHLMYQGQAVKLPAGTGAKVVVQAANKERDRKMHPQERARLQQEIAELQLPCEPVNLGWVARALAAMYRTTSGVEAERWKLHGLSMCENVSGRDAIAACKKLFE